MIGLIAWGAALLIALAVAGILGYGLTGQVRRLQRALSAARTDLEPPLQALQSLATKDSVGRHSAEPTPKS